MRKMVIIALFLAIGDITVVSAQVSQIPQDLKEEMKAEQPEQRETILLAPFLAVAILHFTKADLWVVTKIRMVEVNYWTFRDNDIELISRKVNGKLIVLYQRGERT